ncbi:MAG: hypothetical protein ACPLXC_00235 [Candidatus Pacearchaeota archaeon]
MKSHKLKQAELNEMEACLKEMAFIGTSKNKFKKIERQAYFFNTFEIKRELPNFAEFIDEKYLKEISQKFGGPIIFIGGTTEFDVPTFMRKKYSPTEEEILLRIIYPSEFRTYEVFVDSDRIEARILYKKIRGDDYICYEHYIRAEGIEEITSRYVEDVLEQII